MLLEDEEVRIGSYISDDFEVRFYVFNEIEDKKFDLGFDLDDYDDDDDNDGRVIDPEPFSRMIKVSS